MRCACSGKFLIRHWRSQTARVFFVFSLVHDVFFVETSKEPRRRCEHRQTQDRCCAVECFGVAGVLGAPVRASSGSSWHQERYVVLTMKSTSCVARSVTIGSVVGVWSAITSERVPIRLRLLFCVIDLETCSCVISDREVLDEAFHSLFKKQ